MGDVWDVCVVVVDAWMGLGISEVVAVYVMGKKLSTHLSCFFCVSEEKSFLLVVCGVILALFRAAGKGK